MNDTVTKPRLSQESITILSVGGALLGTAVALGALILSTTGRIEHRIERVDSRIERVEDRLLAIEKETAALRAEIERVVERLFAVENETASLRIDITGLSARFERLEAAAIGTTTAPSTSKS